MKFIREIIKLLKIDNVLRLFRDFMHFNDTFIKLLQTIKVALVMIIIVLYSDHSFAAKYWGDFSSGGGFIASSNYSAYTSANNISPTISSSSNYLIIQGLVQFPASSVRISSNTVTVDNQNETVVTAPIDSGNVEVAILKNTFDINISITVSKITTIPSIGTELKPTNLGVEINASVNNLTINKLISIKIPYRISDIFGMNENNLRIYIYSVGPGNNNLGRWIPLEDISIDKTNKTVSAKTRKLGKFLIMEALPISDFSKIKIYPNPLDKTKGYSFVRFENIPEDVVLKIFTISGENIFTVSNNNTGGVIVWEGKNDSGEDVANGIYYYHIKDIKGKIKRGKIFVIR